MSGRVLDNEVKEQWHYVRGIFFTTNTHINFRRETSLGIWFFRILYLLQSRRSSPWLFLFKPFDVTKALPSTNNLHAAGAILQAVGDKVRVASKTSNWPNVFITKPTRCTNFTNLFGMKLYMFRTVPLSIIRSLFTVHSDFEQDQDETAVPSWSCSKAVYKPVWHIPLLSVQWINSWWWT